MAKPAKQKQRALDRLIQAKKGGVYGEAILCVALSADETKITKCQSEAMQSGTEQVRSGYGAGTEQV